MSDKVSNLGTVPSIDSDDFVYVVGNASGTYTSYKMPISDFLTFLESYHYTESEVDSLLAAKAASVHDHNTLYYTEAEVDALLADKADSILCKYDATTAPGATDDTGSGYEIGSLWIDVTNDEAYRCADASASAAVWVNTSLEIGELGSMASQSASSVAITGGSISGITDLAVADGGTGASTAAGARTNLGLVIGTDVQAYDADLDDVAANITAAGKALIDDADAAAQRTTLGLGTIATQAASSVAITGGTIEGALDIADTLTSSTGTVDLDLTKTAGKLTLTENTSINFPALTSLPTGGMLYYHLRVTGASTYTLAFNASFDAGDPTPDVTMTAGAYNDYMIIFDKDAGTGIVMSLQVGGV